MSPLEKGILVAYAAIVLAWPIRHLVVWWMFRNFDMLTPDSPGLAEGADAPTVTAIIPAKDEEGTIGDCLRSVLAQDYPNLDVLVVDDRSADRTGEVARQAAAGDRRVRLLVVSDLPSGWTGKTHALHLACDQARGEWLWFLDADTRHHPKALAVALEYAQSRGAALMSLNPEQRCETFWEKVVQPLEGIVLTRSFPPRAVNDDRKPRTAYANGQFILARRQALEAVGGYASVRDRFLEDIAIARRFKSAGLPIRLAFGTAISSTRMYHGLGPLVRGWARILYDGLGRRPLPIVGKIVEPLVFSQSGDVALVVALGMLLTGHAGPFAWWLLGLSVAHQVLKQSLLWKMYRLSSPRTARYALHYPLAGIVSAWISIKAILLCYTRRVTWRGTSYPPPAGGAKS